MMSAGRQPESLDPPGSARGAAALVADEPGSVGEVEAIETWFAERGYRLEYDLTTGSTLEPGWMAVVMRVRGAASVPAHLTGYGATKLDAARSARQRVLRHGS